MSGAKKQDAATERFMQCFLAAKLLHPRNATVLFIQDLLRHNRDYQVASHYSHMLEWLPK